MTKALSVATVLAFVALPACGGDDGDPAPAPEAPTGIEIEGTWSSNFGGTDVIDDDSWSSDFGSGAIESVLVEFDNEENVAITQSPDDGSDFALKYNRIVWTEIDAGSFYYCTSDFGLDTLDEAQAADSAVDDSDPENSGCGGFSWTKLTKE